MLLRRDTESLIEGCAREPIHIPGAIQPQGCLLACDSRFRLSHVSVNVERYLGLSAAELLGKPLSILIDPDLYQRWSSSLADSGASAWLGACTVRGGRFDVTAHRRNGRLIVELEPGAGAELPASAYLASHFAARLREAQSAEQICAIAVAELRRITGFGRVLAYAFDDDGHGRVVAEEAEPDYERYMGLHFPAADIPPQARELYRINPIRLIADADYEPVPLVAAPGENGPLDLSLSALRSVSPVHLQYMRNMGTLASMSISILVGGRLWGLISCHHHQPRAVSPAIRSACELVGGIVSLQVEADEIHAATRRRLELRNLMVTLLASMADHDSVVDGLRSIPQTLLDFGAASGAAVVTGEGVLRVGDAPDEEALERLVAWLALQPDRSVFATEALGQTHPGAQVPDVYGMMALAISEIHPHYLLWFRPEVVSTVTWAGEPAKLPNAAGDALSPRTSFGAWQEIVRGRALPWEPESIDAAVTLRDSVRGIVLRKAEELAAMAGELRQANGELEAFSYSVSHDLRAPLRHIAGYAELLQEDELENLSERGRHYLDNIGESVRFAGTLVDELLAFSQMGRAALRLANVDLGGLVQRIRHELAPDYEGRSIDWVVQPLPVVQCDSAFIHLALRNLIANAIKYTRDRDRARIEIAAQSDGQEHVISVGDNGVGFEMQYAGKLFGVFQRLHSLEEFEGTGIGLANVRRIVERHGGRVWAEGAPGSGASFFFSLPRVIPSRALHSRAHGANEQGG